MENIKKKKWKYKQKSGNIGIKQNQDLNILWDRLTRMYDLLVDKKDKALEKLYNKFKNKKKN